MKNFYLSLVFLTFCLGSTYSQENDSPKYEKEYKIGDEGPAGGIIFYDKGVFSGGWRFLEAEKRDLKINNWEGAIESCKKHYSRGKNDWRLPSIEELTLLFTNLKKKNLGNFSDRDYWSSSEDSRGGRCVLGFEKGNEYAGILLGYASVRPIRSF